MKNATFKMETGCMFSGKTLALVHQLEIAKFAGKNPQAFKLNYDNRGEGIKEIRVRGGSSFPATPVGESSEILNKLKKGVRVVGIDEIQFLDSGIVQVVEKLLDFKIDVYASGLPLDFRKKPFGAMSDLVLIADKVRVHHARCTLIDPVEGLCGKPALFTQRLTENTEEIVVGDEEMYAPRCRGHYVQPS